MPGLAFVWERKSDNEGAAVSLCDIDKCIAFGHKVLQRIQCQHQTELSSTHRKNTVHI